MNKHALFFFLMGSACCQALATNTLTFSDSRLRFSFIVTDTSVFRSPIKQVVVADRKSGDTLQRLELPWNEGYIPAFTASDYIPDVNFDGYSDIHIFVTAGAGPNSVDLYFVFDEKKKSFARDTVLEHIPSATFDPRTKTIGSSWTDGCCAHGENTYRYAKGKPVLIKEKECKPDGGIEGRSYLSTVKIRKGGKMMLVKKRHLTDKYVSTVGFGW
jgi:hypothetical protein